MKGYDRGPPVAFRHDENDEIKARRLRQMNRLYMRQSMTKNEQIEGEELMNDISNNVKIGELVPEKELFFFFS